MGFRFRKSVKIAPGVRLNVNKKSVGISVGGKGMRHTVNSKGQSTTTVGIPGTGVSYTHTSSPQKKSGRSVSAENIVVSEAESAPLISTTRSHKRQSAVRAQADITKTPKRQKQTKAKVKVLLVDRADKNTIFCGIALLVVAFFTRVIPIISIVVAFLGISCFVAYVLHKRNPNALCYITPEQLARWRSLLSVNDGNTYELGKKSLPVLVDLKEKINYALACQDGSTVLELQKKIVDFSEFVVIRGDNPVEDLEKYSAAFKIPVQ